MLGEALSEGNLCLEILGIFSQSLILLFYPQIHVQGHKCQELLVMGYILEPWLSACSLESPQPLSQSLESLQARNICLQ